MTSFYKKLGVGYTAALLTPASVQDWVDGGVDKYLDITPYRLWAFKNNKKWMWSVQIKYTDYTLIEGEADSCIAAQTAAMQMYQIIDHSLFTMEQYKKNST